VCPLAASAVSVSCLALQLGGTALHWASGEGHQGVVEVLFAQGADLNVKDNVSSFCIPVPLQPCSRIAL
jgi:ankyrin repeat protein